MHHATEPTMPNILQTLKAEHEQLSSWFEQLDATTDRAQKTRTQLLEKIVEPHDARSVFADEGFGDDN